MKIIRDYSLFLSTLMAVLLSGAITSCDRNEATTETAAGDGSVLVALNGVETRAGSLFAGDEVIGKLRVIVCAGQTVEKSQLFIAGTDDFDNPFEVTVTTGAKTVYVVANETAALAPQLSTVLSKGALEALLAGEINGKLSLPLVMSGKTGDGTVNVTTGVNNQASVSLLRAAAKIKLQFKKDTNDEVIIKKVSLLSNTGKTSLFEGLAAVSPQTYWDYQYLLPGDINLTDMWQPVNNGDYVYMYENLAGAASVPDKDHAVRLEVEALYNGIETVYRVYINENVTTTPTTPGSPGDPESSVTTPGDHLYSLKRNHEYRLEGVIKNIGEFEGLTLTAKVLPWSRLSSEVDFKPVFSISPQPTATEHEYGVTGASSAVSFTFQLTSPPNASWTAHLTNPVAFTFDGAHSGTAGGSSVTITVKPAQGQGANAHATGLYITVDGVEVPLIEGSRSAGPGNRIVINQPAN